MRNLASIQTIIDVQPIEGADKIERVDVLGWHCVAKKGQFKKNDLCIYFEVDSLLPVCKQLEFLAKDGTRTILGEDNKEHTGYRLKTIRLRKQISQGLVMPLSDFGIKGKEGEDVTEKMGVVKYERLSLTVDRSSRKPVVFPNWVPTWFGFWVKKTFPNFAIKIWGKSMKAFPSYIHKTDETRIQAIPKVFKKYQNRNFYVTEKLDGSSITVFLDKGNVQVCSRSIWLVKDEKNQFWKAILPIEDKLKNLGSIALQGELIGEGIQSNRLKIKGQEIYFFNAYDFKRDKYLNYADFSRLVKSLGLRRVPVVDRVYRLPETIDQLVKYSTRNSKLNKDCLAEGLVFRPVREVDDPKLGRLSFKCINPEYLLKHGE